MSIALLHIAECPGWETTEQRIRLALSLLKSSEDLEVVLVESLEAAVALGFTGSPTVLIDGEDPFAVGDSPPALACRLYQTEAGLSSSPTLDQLVAALERRT